MKSKWMLVNCESEERVGCNLGPGVSAAISSSEKYPLKNSKIVFFPPHKSNLHLKSLTKSK